MRQAVSHGDLVVRVPLVRDPFFQSLVDASTVLGGPLAPNGTRSVLVADLELPTGVARRQHAWTERGWSPADDACAGEPASFFWFDGELWSATLSVDGVVSWGAWR